MVNGRNFIDDSNEQQDNYSMLRHNDTPPDPPLTPITAPRLRTPAQCGTASTNHRLQSPNPNAKGVMKRISYGESGACSYSTVTDHTNIAGDETGDAVDGTNDVVNGTENRKETDNDSSSKATSPQQIAHTRSETQHQNGEFVPHVAVLYRSGKRGPETDTGTKLTKHKNGMESSDNTTDGQHNISSEKEDEGFHQFGTKSQAKCMISPRRRISKTTVPMHRMDCRISTGNFCTVSFADSVPTRTAEQPIRYSQFHESASMAASSSASASARVEQYLGDIVGCSANPGCTAEHENAVRAVQAASALASSEAASASSAVLILATISYSEKISKRPCDR